MKTKFIVILIYCLCLFGCEKKTEALQTPPESNATSKVKAKAPEPPKDPIEAAIRKELKKPNGELTKAAMEKVTRLGLGGAGITDLSPLVGLINLTALGLHGNQITDLSPLKGLVELRVLDLNYNPNLSKREVAKLQEALPNCKILCDATE
tara:strand:+ start:32 stop:484 length:453 start_codon:yes stop_codon:yes gene_type:complete